MKSCCCCSQRATSFARDSETWLLFDQYLVVGSPLSLCPAFVWCKMGAKRICLQDRSMKRSGYSHGNVHSTFSVSLIISYRPFSSANSQLDIPVVLVHNFHDRLFLLFTFSNLLKSALKAPSSRMHPKLLALATALRGSFIDWTRIVDVSGQKSAAV